MAPIYSEQLLDELADIIDINRILEDKKSSPIIFDGRQYTIKIPKRLADKASIGNKDVFEFKVVTEIIEGRPVTRLVGEMNDKDSA